MVGREEQTDKMNEALEAKYSSFVAITGRRRVGKTFLIRTVYQNHIQFSVTGIQNADIDLQIKNFIAKLTEYGGMKYAKTNPKNWQDVFILLKKYLQSLPKTKKHVIFIDELPWMATVKSGFIQLLAHLWNDYLSKEKHFILVVCGSATSWITQKIINDKGGFHNRVNVPLHLKPFTLSETKRFLQSKKINYSDTGITDIYMALGGLPYYLEQIKRGESPIKAIERLCFSETGILKYEYNNLYKALFENWENHEAIVKVLALSKQGLSRNELIRKSKVKSGGPFVRAISDLIITGFVTETFPYGKNKRGLIYRLIDEFSIFYHRFMKGNEKKDKSIWPIIANSQGYKVWKGFAFETVCFKHIDEIKAALGIKSVYTEQVCFTKMGSKSEDGFQIDLVIDRKDDAINLCECKYYGSNFEVTKVYAQTIKNRRAKFQQATKTKKMIINTFISNETFVRNAYYHEVVDEYLNISELM